VLQNLRVFFSHRLAISAGLIFLVNSFLFGSWITRLPEIKNHLQLSDGDLGLALLGMPLGSLIIMPFMGWFTQRWGSGRITLLCGILFCFVSITPVLATSYMHLIVALILVGLGTGSMDIAMNAAAAGVEKKYRISIMSSCHGLWSLGAMTGAGSAGIIAGLGVSPRIHVFFVAAALLILVFILSPTIITIKDPGEPGKAFAWPTGPLLGLALIGFCVGWGEGAMADWSAVYLRNTLSASPYISGLGFAGFAGAMALGRFYGDQIIPDWGAKSVVVRGCLISTIALALGLALPLPWLAIGGFTLAGIGFSCLIPAIFISAAHTPGLSSGTGIAAVASVSYLGMLSGPPVIGIVAENFGLNLGLVCVVLIMAIATVLSWRTQFH